MAGENIMMNDDSDQLQNESSFPGDHQSPEITPSRLDCAVASPPATARVREYVAPRNEIEASVAEILAEFLMIERVGIHDNLILLGGESLLAAQVAWRIRDRFACEVSLRSILTGSVADIAAEISAAKSDSSTQ
jgi:acyl carrier protein